MAVRFPKAAPFGYREVTAGRLDTPAKIPSGFPALPFLSCAGKVMAKILNRIVAEVPGGYAVEVKAHGSLLHFELGFATEAEARVASQAKATKGIDRWERRADRPPMRRRAAAPWPPRFSLGSPPPAVRG